MTEEDAVRAAYQALAGTIAALVAVQAMLAAYGAVAPVGAPVGAPVSGAHEHSHGGGHDHAAASVEAAPSGGVVAHDLHAAFGHYLIPLLVLALLVVAAFAAVPRGLLAAGLIAWATALQVTAGVLSHRLPEAGLVHGLNAFVLFSLAAMAAVFAHPRRSQRQREQLVPESLPVSATEGG